MRPPAPGPSTNPSTMRRGRRPVPATRALSGRAAGGAETTRASLQVSTSSAGASSSTEQTRRPVSRSARQSMPPRSSASAGAGRGGAPNASSATNHAIAQKRTTLLAFHRPGRRIEVHELDRRGRQLDDDAPALTPRVAPDLERRGRVELDLDLVDEI